MDALEFKNYDSEAAPVSTKNPTSPAPTTVPGKAAPSTVVSQASQPLNLGSSSSGSGIQTSYSSAPAPVFGIVSQSSVGSGSTPVSGKGAETPSSSIPSYGGGFGGGFGSSEEEVPAEETQPGTVQKSSNRGRILLLILIAAVIGYAAFGKKIKKA